MGVFKFEYFKTIIWTVDRQNNVGTPTIGTNGYSSHRSHNLRNTRRLVLSRPLLQPQFNALQYAIGMHSSVPPSPQSGIDVLRKGKLANQNAILAASAGGASSVTWWRVLQVSCSIRGVQLASVFSPRYSQKQRHFSLSTHSITI
jgi:hypothetical protein